MFEVLIALSMVAFDPLNDSPYCLQFASVKWKSLINIERLDSRNVAFNNFRLKCAVSGRADPLNNCAVSGWEVAARLSEYTLVESAEVNVGLLASRVGFSGTRCQSMP